MNRPTNNDLRAYTLGLIKDKEARNIISRACRKMWKKTKLKTVECIIVNDYDRKDLSFQFDDSKYQYLDIETVHYTKLTDGEIHRLRKLKRINIRAWVIAVAAPMKCLLNEVREKYRKERIILCVSNLELAHELHIPAKNITVYCRDDELMSELKDEVDLLKNRLVDDEALAYLNRERNKQIRHPYIEYKSVNKLKQQLASKFANGWRFHLIRNLLQRL